LVKDLKTKLNNSDKKIKRAVVHDEVRTLRSKINAIADKLHRVPKERDAEINHYLNEYLNLYLNLLKRHLVAKPDRFLDHVGIRDDRLVVLNAANLLTPEEARAERYLPTAESDFSYRFLDWVVNAVGVKFSLSDDFKDLVLQKLTKERIDIILKDEPQSELVFFRGNRKLRRLIETARLDRIREILKDHPMKVPKPGRRHETRMTDENPIFTTFFRIYGSFEFEPFTVGKYLEHHKEKSDPTVRGHLKHLEAIGAVERVPNPDAKRINEVNYRLKDFKRDDLDQMVFALVQYGSKHDFDTIRSQLKKIQAEKKLFVVPKKPVDYRRVAKSLKNRYPDLGRGVNVYITFLILKKHFFGGAFKLSSVFNYVDGISLGAFRDQIYFLSYKDGKGQQQ